MRRSCAVSRPTGESGGCTISSGGSAGLKLKLVCLFRVCALGASQAHYFVATAPRAADARGGAPTDDAPLRPAVATLSGDDDDGAGGGGGGSVVLSMPVGYTPRARDQYARRRARASPGRRAPVTGSSSLLVVGSTPSPVVVKILPQSDTRATLVLSTRRFQS